MPKRPMQVPSSAVRTSPGALVAALLAWLVLVAGMLHATQLGMALAGPSAGSILCSVAGEAGAEGRNADGGPDRLPGPPGPLACCLAAGACCPLLASPPPLPAARAWVARRPRAKPRRSPPRASGEPPGPPGGPRGPPPRLPPS